MKLEGQQVVRIHKRHRKSLFVPTGAKDMPVGLDEFAEQRRTEVTFEDGTIQVLEDNWVTSAEPSCALECNPTWTGRTLFKLKASPTGKSLRFKTDNVVPQEPQRRILNVKTLIPSQKINHARFDRERLVALFKLRSFVNLCPN